MNISFCKKCGKECQILFRWSKKHPVTGETIRAHKRPFPIPLCDCE